MKRSAAILCLLAFSTSALAQVPPARRPATPTPQPTPTGATEAAPARAAAPALPQDDTLVTLDFKGGTIGDYINAVRASAGANPVNVVFNEETAALPMYPVRLTNASVWSALGAVERSTYTPEGRSLGVRLGRPSAPPPGGTPTYFVTSETPPPSPYPPTSSFAQEVAVISLNPIINGPTDSTDKRSKIDAKTVLSAIETAVGLVSNSKSDALVMQFHETSGLLFIKGSAQQQRAAKEVIAQLQNDVLRGQVVRDPMHPTVITRRFAVSVSTDKLPGVVELIKQNFGKGGAIQVEAEGALLVVSGQEEVVDKVEEYVKSIR